MRVADALREILECAEEALDTPVCRAFWHPGDGAPHDVCSATDVADGQLWVAHLNSSSGWPGPTGEPHVCADAWREQIEVGIVRCARGKLTDSGDAPTPEDITWDAEQQESDRLALRGAILCCVAVEGRDLIVGDWQPISPLGGCVGGIWTIFVRDSGCDCGTLGS